MIGAEPQDPTVEPAPAAEAPGPAPVRAAAVVGKTPSGTPGLTTIGRALILIGAVGASIGFGIGTLLIKGPLDAYLTGNALTKRPRTVLLAVQLGTAVGLALAAAAAAFVRRRDPGTPARVANAARRLAPLGVVGFLPLLFRLRAWLGHDLGFLIFAALAVFVFQAGLRMAAAATPFAWEAWFWRRARLSAVARLARSPHLPQWGLALVVAGAAAYAAYFAYYTCAWYYGVHSGWDLAIENNLLWNLIHGNQFMKSSPVFGPVGTHFGHHATLFAYVIAPFYALAQNPYTLLIIQSLLIGGAAVPLYLYARRHLGVGLSCLIALSYLLYPAVHGPNLYEFHYLPLGTFFLWTTLYALEARRPVLTVVAVVLTMSVREDVSAGLVILGMYLVLSGRRPRAGLIVTGVGAVYFLAMKMVVMPRFAGGGETFTYMFEGLLPRGENSFGGVLKTILGNPVFTLDNVLEQAKLVYLLQLLLPLAFLPLRHPLAPLFVIPGVLFTLMTTHHGPAISIHYQYPAHWTTYLFIALVLVLARMPPLRRPAAVGALALGLLACSYQYGSIFQQETSYGGPIKFKFGVNAEDGRRRRGMDAVLKHLPPGGKVASSAFAIPQASSRANDYSLTLGLYDAEYLLFPTDVSEFIVDERQKVIDQLSSGTFGVVAVQDPYALARRGHRQDLNAALLARLR